MGDRPVPPEHELVPDRSRPSAVAMPVGQLLTDDQPSDPAIAPSEGVRPVGATVDDLIGSADPAPIEAEHVVDEHRRVEVSPTADDHSLSWSALHSRSSLS